MNGSSSPAANQAGIRISHQGIFKAARRPNATTIATSSTFSEAVMILPISTTVPSSLDGLSIPHCEPKIQASFKRKYGKTPIAVRTAKSFGKILESCARRLSGDVSCFIFTAQLSSPR